MGLGAFTGSWVVGCADCLVDCCFVGVFVGNTLMIIVCKLFGDGDCESASFFVRDIYTSSPYQAIHGYTPCSESLDAFTSARQRLLPVNYSPSLPEQANC